MQISFKNIIEKLQTLETRFNASKDPVERFAILEAVNHIAKHELPFKKTGNDAWIWEQHYKAMLREQGAHI